jgi:hypothetical protein
MPPRPGRCRSLAVGLLLMGNLIFGVDVAGIVAEVIGPNVFDVTITREVRGARSADNLTGGPVAAAPGVFECKGFWDDLSGTPKPGVEYELSDRKLVLIGDTIPPGGVPQRNDAATVHEPIGDLTLYVVQPLRRDAAAAVYEFLCRDRRGPDGQ